MQTNTSEYFYELETIESYSNGLLDLINSTKFWFQKNNLHIIKVENIFFNDSILSTLIERFNGTPLIFKLPPNIWYDWHTDENRLCAINMLILGNRSHCFFGERENRDIVKTRELTYNSNRYYLLNTQKKHAVLNFEEPRYVLSVGFAGTHDYFTVLQFCKDNKL